MIVSSSMGSHSNKNISLVLYNLRSVYNVGSIFRTADAAGITKLYLVGTTPTPIDRFGRMRNDMAKVALGAEESVTWQYADDIKKLLSSLQSDGVGVVALEQSKHSLPYSEFSHDTPIAIIVGEETEGVPTEVIEKCNTAVEIPMYGSKESLNVAVATGIIAFYLRQGL